MRLQDLDGEFVYAVAAGRYRRSSKASLQGMQGIRFQCPSCGAGKPTGKDGRRRFIVGAHYVLVLFSNPRGVSPAPADASLRNDGTPNPRWSIESGSSLDDLTLSPSVNCDIPWKDEQGVEHPSSCKFHGWVKNGDAE